jgi:hypothetical protein
MHEAFISEEEREYMRQREKYRDSMAKRNNILSFTGEGRDFAENVRYALNHIPFITWLSPTLDNTRDLFFNTRKLHQSDTIIVIESTLISQGSFENYIIALYQSRDKDFSCYEISPGHEEKEQDNFHQVLDSNYCYSEHFHLKAIRNNTIDSVTKKLFAHRVGIDITYSSYVSIITRHNNNYMVKYYASGRLLTKS